MLGVGHLEDDDWLWLLVIIKSMLISCSSVGTSSTNWKGKHIPTLRAGI